MAHKSKTQRAKAAEKDANRKERQQRVDAAAENTASATAQTGEEQKASIVKKKETKPEVKQQATAVKKAEKPKKTRFQFLKDVRAEMKRVTWPTRQDVTRWTGVVVGALIFFGVYVAVLDNVIITPALVAVSSLGA